MHNNLHNTEVGETLAEINSLWINDWGKLDRWRLDRGTYAVVTSRWDYCNILLLGTAFDVGLESTVDAMAVAKLKLILKMLVISCFQARFKWWFGTGNRTSTFFSLGLVATWITCQRTFSSGSIVRGFVDRVFSMVLPLATIVKLPGPEDASCLKPARFQQNL